jgi:hypothetical protein
MSDQSGLGPDTVITGPVWDMWPTVSYMINLVKAGVFTAQDFGGFSFMSKGGSYLAPYHKFDAKLPADVRSWWPNANRRSWHLPCEHRRIDSQIRLRRLSNHKPEMM